MDKTLYVLVGLPGSGKSTYIAEIKTIDPEAIVLSTDNYIEAKAKEDGLTYSDVFQTYIKDAEVNLKTDLSNAITDGNSIIWDQTNLRIKKRKTILNQIPKDYEKIAVEFIVPFDVIIDRVKARGDATGKHIGYGIVKSMEEGREAVTVEEGFDKVLIIDQGNLTD